MAVLTSARRTGARQRNAQKPSILLVEAACFSSREAICFNSSIEWYSANHTLSDTPASCDRRRGTEPTARYIAIWLYWPTKHTLSSVLTAYITPVRWEKKCQNSNSNGRYCVSMQICMCLNDFFPHTFWALQRFICRNILVAWCICGHSMRSQSAFHSNLATFSMDFDPFLWIDCGVQRANISTIPSALTNAGHIFRIYLRLSSSPQLTTAKQRKPDTLRRNRN